MISAEQNERMTRVGAQAPAGALLRSYWHPVALTEELSAERPLRPLTLLGQKFVLFRDDKDRLGLLDRHCPHRGADLAFGRLEDGGLRCTFHGWLFDVHGSCKQTPAEPPGSHLCSRIKQRSYPVLERSGTIFAYLGEGVPPPLPSLDCLIAPDTHTFSFKGFLECNWLQALEVGIDPAHASFLHRFFADDDPAASYGKQFRGASADSDVPITRILREFERPEIVVAPTDYGMRLVSTRGLDSGTEHVRVTNLLFPNAFVIPMSSDMTISQWHVPVDDTHCYWHAVFTSFADPVDKTQMRQQRLTLYELPDYTSRRNKRNDYGYNARDQHARTYTGMGDDINVHDQWAVESQGPIQDRTREHLGSTDKGIAAYRRMLLEAISRVEAGESAPHRPKDEADAQLVTGPASIDGISRHGQSADVYWREADQLRRRLCPWMTSQQAP